MAEDYPRSLEELEARFTTEAACLQDFCWFVATSESVAELN
jgi:hypothetical protein